MNAERSHRFTIGAGWIKYLQAHLHQYHPVSAAPRLRSYTYFLDRYARSSKPMEPSQMPLRTLALLDIWAIWSATTVPRPSGVVSSAMPE